MGCCFGLSITSSLRYLNAGSGETSASQQTFTGFTDPMLIGLVIMELVLGAMALGMLKFRGYDVQSLYPTPTWRGSLHGAALYVCTFFVTTVIGAFFVGTLDQQPIVQAMTQSRPSLHVVILMALVNGAFEEVFLLGFLMRGMRQHGLAIALGMPLVVRALTHVYQGPFGVVSVLAFGLVLGLAYARSNRLYPMVLAHMLADIVPFVAH